jgi:hypothetical protein
MSDTYIDGGGLQRDIPLGTGTRIRLSPTGWGEEDVTVCVADGQLVIAGIKRPLDIQPLAANVATVRTKEI